MRNVQLVILSFFAHVVNYKCQTQAGQLYFTLKKMQYHYEIQRNMTIRSNAISTLDLAAAIKQLRLQIP